MLALVAYMAGKGLTGLQEKEVSYPAIYIPINFMSSSIIIIMFCRISSE